MSNTLREAGFAAEMAGVLHVAAPLIYSEGLSRTLDAEVWLKMDNCQPSGSFKLRGIGLACQRAKERGYTKLVSSSGVTQHQSLQNSISCLWDRNRL